VLDRLDDSVAVARGDAQTAAELRDRLAVQCVDAARMPAHRLQLRLRGNDDPLAWEDRAHFRVLDVEAVETLVERAAEVDIEELTPAADAEDRQSAEHRGVDQSHLERVAQRITAAVARDASGPHGSELADQPGEREENEVEQPRPRRLRGTLSFGDVEQLLPVELRIDVRPAADDQAVYLFDVARVFRRDANSASAREIA
jgi:hypothetical protein